MKTVYKIGSAQSLQLCKNIDAVRKEHKNPSKVGDLTMNLDSLMDFLFFRIVSENNSIKWSLNPNNKSAMLCLLVGIIYLIKCHLYIILFCHPSSVITPSKYISCMV